MDSIKAGGQRNYSIKTENHKPGKSDNKTNSPEKASRGNEMKPAVAYEKNQQPPKKINYEKPKPNMELVNKLKAEADQRYQGLRTMVSDMLKKQGLTFQDVLSGKTAFVDETTRAAAQKSIEPGGEHSVDAVAGRIVDFAKAISGGDPSKAKEMRAAIEKGFAEARKAFGGSLPDISDKTHTEIMKRLDAWEQGE